MNINLRFLNNLMLLEAMYNHFAHYFQAKIYKREMNESGSYQNNLEKGAISKNRQRFCWTHYKFGIAEKFPKPYLKVLTEIDSHSNDEFDEKVNGYIIKLLPYCSQNATTFICRVDEEIAKASTNQRGKSQKHQCIISKAALPTTFGWPPKGLRIDFFDHQWHPNEKLSDKKFSEIYWDQLTQKYDLSHETTTYEDGHESNSEDEDIESDPSSNIDRESSEENEEEENRNLDSDEEMADKSQAVGHFSNAEYGFEWEKWQ
ncbi:hypothetical protein O181_015591 [Austropuccinia psidii MF-1]|uniref:Uncharacterized protein n=1 Tax=Austropuccinia psidii MF-1 TaxID=1389203 RepID=A0A9Q3C070_9BASI|nr:hypothetical protein [Austropuccinia psidii MF-1]